MSEYVTVVSESPSSVVYKVNVVNGRQIHTVRVDGQLVSSDTQPIQVVWTEA